MNIKSLFITIAAISILLFGASAVAGKIIYVDDSASGANNGSSWLNAYRYLQDALAAATTGDQVLVAQGIYKPDKGQGITPGDRSASFRLINGLTLKGGYAGFGTPNPDARDVETYKTILSGDLAGNDIEVADPAELLGEPTRSENSYNIVNASGCDRTALLEGFTITGGNANATMLSGGGIINGKPTVSQCKIVANSAASSGGGIYFDHTAHAPGALLKDSTVSHNTANSGGGIYNCAEIINCIISGNSAIDGYAGGIYFGSDCETSVTDSIISNNSAAGNAGGVFISFSGSEVIFTRCSFTGNSARYEGGAIYADGCTCGSYSTFYQCKFIANSAAGNGGAICDYGFTDMQLYSCLLVGNSSGGNGGALCDEYDGGSALVNCTVANNTAAGQGGAICYDRYSYKGRRLGNTIIWGNSDRNGQTHQYSQIYLIEVSELQDVTNCCIQVIPPEIEGQNNITSNPLFVDIDGPDNIPGNEDDNLHLFEGSGCIDTGHNEYVPQPASDLDGKPRIANGTVDRGAYEYARQQPGIIYVDARVSGANNGSSWADAYKFLQDALRAASSSDEIRIAQGIYKPDKGQGITPGDRSASFHLTNGLTIKGGYAGFGTPNHDTRDTEAYETILSGDLNGNDVPVSDPCELLNHPNRADNSYHVITAASCEPGTILDGLTITAGNANGTWQSDNYNGGGIHLGNPTISHCKVVSNSAMESGGGINFTRDYYSGYSSGGKIYNSIISDNAAASAGGVYGLIEMSNCIISNNRAAQYVGGGIELDTGQHAKITDCTFTNNSAYYDGGAFAMFSCSPILTNCIFAGNSSMTNGGAIHINGCDTCMISYPQFYNCKIITNYAKSGGGAICHTGYSLSKLFNCIITGNTAGDFGGAIYDQYTRGNYGIWLINCTLSGNYAKKCGGLYASYSTSSLTNSILWGNIADDVTGQDAQIMAEETAELEINYCCIQGWNGSLGGIRNMGGDPLFVNPGNGDYHLQPVSPCVDTGDSSAVPPSVTTDLDGKPRIINDTVDRGAYEYSGGQPGIIYVDDSATGANNGSSWKDAFGYLQVGILTASAGDEIRVAGGIYKPNEGIIGDIPDQRALTFQLKNGVTIKGGYAGFGQPNPDNRNIEVYQTILSGDIRGNDVDVNDPEKLGREPTRSENSYRVVTGSQTDATAIIDGFTITGGYANYDDFSQCNGAGMFNDNGSPTVLNCTFIANFAGNGDGGGLGGAMYNYGGSPTLTNCSFIYNAAIALDGGEGAGGAMGNWSSNPTLTNCIFSGNIAGRDGGGIWSYESNPVLVNCLFIGNLAREGGSGSFGGGMWNYNGSASLINCTFAGNTARSSQIGSGGGGIWAAQGNVTLINCTFNGNVAGRGGAISGDYPYEGGVFLLSNCILWNDKPQEIYTPTTPPVVTYSDVQSGWPGQGNINADPLFVDADGPDNIIGSDDDDLHLLFGSRCLDVGSNSAFPPAIITDLDGRPRIIAGIVDMGAYEFYMLCVDDDAPADPGPGNPQISDPLENGSNAHPFDSIQEAIDKAKNGYSVVVRPGSYLSSDQWTYDELRFCGKNITLMSTNPNDPEVVGKTVLQGTILFSGTEEPNCELSGFKVHNLGYGAVYGAHTHATISYCVISGNGPCGGTVLKDWDGIISNCLITDNTTFSLCGVYPAIFGCNGLIKNCTIANNIGGVSVGDATVENCIIYNNAGHQLAVTNGGTLSISYSDIQGGLSEIVGGGNVDWGIGNFDTDPCFVRLGYWVQKNPPPILIEGDYHLKSQGWRWNADSKSWTYDDVTSRCIDAGNPGEPLGDEPLTVPRDPEGIWGENIRINMGAYGGTMQASMAPTPFALGLPPPDIGHSEIGHWALLADLNNDGIVDMADVAGQVQDWLNNKAGRPGDLNRNGVVNMVDFALLAEDWLSMTAWLE